MYVSGGAGRYIVEHQFLGCASAERDYDVGKHLLLGGVILLIFAGAINRHAACGAAGDYGDIFNRVFSINKFPGYGVAGLMIGGELLRLFGHHLALFFGTGDNLEDRLVYLGLRYEAAFSADGENCRFV